MLPLDCQVDAMDIPPAEDPMRWSEMVVSPMADLPVAEGRGARLEWTAGNGLRIDPEVPDAELILFAPYALAGASAPVGRWGVSFSSALSIQLSSEREREIGLFWTDERCVDFSPTCSRTIPVAARSRQLITLQLAPELSGHARRLKLVPGDRGTFTIHSLMAGAIGDEPSEAPGPLALVGGESAPRVRVRYQMDAENGPDNTLKLTFFEGRRDPFLVFDLGRPAAEAALLIVEGENLPAGPLEVFFTNETCPAFSESCRIQLDPTRRGSVWFGDLRRHPGWRGTIARLRIDFRPSPDSVGRLKSLRFASRSEYAAAQERLRPGATGEPGGLSRSEHSGLLHWVLRPGERLTCGVPDELAEAGQPPRNLTVTVPGGQRGGPRFFRLRADWVSSDGRSEEAAALIEGFDRSSRRGQTRRLELALRPPQRPPEKLEVELACVENCARTDPQDVSIEVDRPWGKAHRAPSGSEDMRRNLILVVIDTLRADHLSTYGYDEETDPHTARWARGATVYEKVHAADVWTLPGHSALFTGRYPLDLTYNNSKPQLAYHSYLGPEHETLAEVLQAEGYRTIAYTDPGYLAPSFGLDQGFELYDATWEPFEQKVQRALQSARELAREETPFFLFLHTYEVHEPYSLGSFSDPGAYGGATPAPSATWGVVDWARKADSAGTVAAFYRSNYDESIRAVDAALAPLLEARDLGAVLCVTSDHGESLFEYDRLGHGGDFANPTLTWIPLVVSEGSGRGSRSPEPLSQTAVPRILVQAMGLRLAEGRLAPVVRLPSGAVFAVRNPLQETLNITGYGGDLQLFQKFNPDDLELISTQVRQASDGALLFEADGDVPLPMRFQRALGGAVVGARRLGRRWAEVHRGHAPENPGPDVDREDDAMLRALGYAE